MHRFRLALAVALFATAAFAAPAAQAANISVQIVTQVTNNPTFVFGPFADQFVLGEDVRITYTFDDAAVDTTPEVGSGTFISALSQLDVEFLTSGFSFFFGNPMSAIGTSDDVPQGNDNAAFNSASRLGGSLIGGLEPDGIFVSLSQFRAPGPPGDLVVNDRPTAAPFDFDQGVFTVTTNGTDQTQLLLEGGVATAVPEPSLAFLIGGGVFAAAFGIRRR